MANIYEKYRPTSLKEIMGNEDLKRDLRPFLKGSRELPAAILLTGPSGCGKTTIARIIAEKITGNCASDIHELDTADFRGIDAVRDIRRQMQLRPLGGFARCWILDECHMLTTEAQNALLKALEKPPASVYFLLCTTDPQKLLKTIQTRCVHFQVEPLQVPDLIEVLKAICAQEKAKVPADVLKNIAKQSNCSGRLALTHLDRVLARKPEDYAKDLDSIEDFETQVKDLCQSLLARKSWKSISKLLSGLKEDPEKVRRACLGYMNSVLLSGQTNNQAAVVIEYFSNHFFDSGAAGLSLACFYCVNIEEE